MSFGSSNKDTVRVDKGADRLAELQLKYDKLKERHENLLMELVKTGHANELVVKDLEHKLEVAKELQGWQIDKAKQEVRNELGAGLVKADIRTAEATSKLKTMEEKFYGEDKNAEAVLATLKALTIGLTESINKKAPINITNVPGVPCNCD